MRRILTKNEISSGLKELNILFYYALQAKIKSLKRGNILNTNRYNIKDVIQEGFRQLHTTNRYQLTEVFQEPALLFFRQNKYTNIRIFCTIFVTKQEFLVSKKDQKIQFCVQLLLSFDKICLATATSRALIVYEKY